MLWYRTRNSMKQAQGERDLRTDINNTKNETAMNWNRSESRLNPLLAGRRVASAVD